MRSSHPACAAGWRVLLLCGGLLAGVGAVRCSAFGVRFGSVRSVRSDGWARLAASPNTQRSTPNAGHPTPAQLWVYIGTYTGQSRGIYRCELDLRAGALSAPTLAAVTTDPSFLALAPSHRFLYAVNEVDHLPGSDSAAVSAFAIDPATGALRFLNQQSSRGRGPAHLTVDPTGKDVLVANYNNGSVAVLPIGRGGRLQPATGFVQHHGSSVNRARQEGPHAHCVTVDPSGRRVDVADLGLDQIRIYRFDPARGSITPNQPPFAAVTPGSGPRHLAFSPDGRFAYVINEMASTVTVLRYDRATGALRPLQTLSTLPGDFNGTNTAAEIEVHPSGKFLYASNRGHDSIAVFDIDPHTGRLTPAGDVPSGGKTPRSFALDPTGRYLLAANQDSGSVVLFRIDPRTGALAPTGQRVSVPMAVCVVMMPGR